MDYEKQQEVVTKFKKLINTYCWHIREAEKLKSKIEGKALPFLHKYKLHRLSDIEKLINKYNRHNNMLDALVKHEDIINLILKEFNGEIEEINLITKR